MNRSTRLLQVLAGMVICIAAVMSNGMTAQAAKGNQNYLNGLNGGIAVVIDPSAQGAADAIDATAKKLNLTEDLGENSTLVMANVKASLNLRDVPDSKGKKIGKLYKDCGGTILERRDGWTKLQSGNAIGWAKDDYLFFGKEARELADSVGKMVAIMDSAMRVRTAPGMDADVIGLLPQGEIADVLDNSDPNWICIDYEGSDAYVAAGYVTVDFRIDFGETNAEIKAREDAEREAKRHVNYGQYTTDADTTLLLAALIQCEAGGESYEGQVAVGSVVMNRVRSAAYPNSIHGVIYASGQFTPAANGKVNRVYESGKINASCVKAAEEVLAGTSNVGDLTHFRRNNGRAGLVIGNHVFY